MSDVIIKIPPTITLSVGGTQWSFAHFVNYMIDGVPEVGIPGHPLFNHSGSGIRAGVRLQKAINDAKEGDEAKLDPIHGASDRKLLRDAIDSPAKGQGLVPPLSREMPDGSKVEVSVPGKMLVPYLDAVSE